MNIWYLWTEEIWEGLEISPQY